MNRKLVVVALASFGLGAALMLLFDSPLARVLGMAALVTFIVAGLFAVVTAEFLEGEDSDSE